VFKYPRTQHIEGSRLQVGDEDLDSIPFSTIAGQYLVIEEKVDGANSGISFSKDGQMLLQSRGHYLTGGAREKHFNLFKQWAYSLSVQFWNVLGDRYVLYGAWLYAKHTVFYDLLPHYFLEYDVLDLKEQQFLSTNKRQELLDDLPVVAVPILYEGTLSKQKQLVSFLGRSHYITDDRSQKLQQICTEKNLNWERTRKQTDLSDLMEGLYIKVETENTVLARYKYVRNSFLTTMLNSDGHWLDRPIIPNLLHPDVNLFDLKVV
jgi:hypothetical protein